MQVRISGVLFRKGEQKGETGEKEVEEENIPLLFKNEIQRRGTTGRGVTRQNKEAEESPGLLALFLQNTQIIKHI